MGPFSDVPLRQTTQLNDLTFLLAIWGAVISTIALVWNIYHGITDRGSLRVSCMIGQIVPAGAAVPPLANQDFKLIYTVTNAGRRTVFVKNIGGGYRTGPKKNFIIIPHQGPWPRELKTGESLTEWTDNPYDTLLDARGLKFLGAWDSVGRLYKIPRRFQRRLIAEARQAKSGQ